MSFYFKNPNLYVGEIIGDMLPPDAIEISEQLWRDCQRFQWELGEGGLPVPIYVEMPTAAEIAAQETRSARNLALQRSDYMELPSVNKGLTATQRTEILAYRQALRDLPSKDGFPYLALPNTPEWWKR